MFTFALMRMGAYEHHPLEPNGMVTPVSIQTLAENETLYPTALSFNIVSQTFSFFITIFILQIFIFSRTNQVSCVVNLSFSSGHQ